jgi:hypothetical protein
MLYDLSSFLDSYVRDDGSLNEYIEYRIEYVDDRKLSIEPNSRALLELLLGEIVGQQNSKI